jgi:PAS domain S-box-containing protein
MTQTTDQTQDPSRDATHALQHNNAIPFHTLLDAIPTRIYYVDAEGRYRYVNQEYTNFTGRPGNYLIGRTGGDIFVPETWAVLEPFGRRALAGESVRWEGWLTFESGLRYTERVYTPHFAANGVVDGFFVFVRDITELKEHQRDLEQSLKRTRESEAIKTAIIDSALDSVIVVDEMAQVVSFNPVAEQTFGYIGRDVIGRPIAELIIPPDLRELHDAGMRRYLSTGQASVLGQRLEIDAMRADGSIFPVELTITEVKIDSKRLFTAYLRDLTQMHATKLELERQREALHQSEKLAALGSMLAGVAHELNNPLSIVIGNAMMLEEESSDPNAGTGLDQVAARAGKIKTAAERCARIVRTFLMMARQQKAQQREIELGQLAEGVIEFLGYGLRTSGITVTCRFPADLPAVFCDGDQIHQVFANLLINAQQALHKTPLPRRITVTMEHDKVSREVVATIADNGPGVSEEIRSRIFDPFFTTKPSGMGTGVGLAISKGVIESHGGQLTLLPSGQGGATFEIRLPIGTGATDTSPAIGDQMALQPQVGQRALIIDDENGIAEVLAEILRRDGYVSDIVGSGREARAKVTESIAGASTYDAILCDLRMADEDGPTFYQWLEKAQPTLAARLAFVTGDTLSPGASDFLAKCGRPIVEKPFVPATVRRLVNDLARGDLAAIP